MCGERESLGTIHSAMDCENGKVVCRTSLDNVLEFEVLPEVHFKSNTLIGCRVERTIDFDHVLVNGIAIGSVKEKHFQMIFYPSAARKAISRNE